MNPLGPGGNTSEMRTAWGTIFTQLAGLAFVALLVSPWMGFDPDTKRRILDAFFAYVTGSTTLSAFVIHSRTSLKKKAIEAACPPKTTMKGPYG